MTLIADVFPKLRTRKNIVRSMPKKFRFKGSFEKQHVECAQTLLKCEGQLLYHIDWSVLRQFCYKKCLLVICKISRLFPNRLSADGKYSLLNRDNLTHPIQIQVSRKQKTFSEFFSALLKSNLKFEHFQKKKMSLISDGFPKLRTPKNMVKSMSKISHFKGSFGKQHGKRAQKLVKFACSTFTIFIDHFECNCLTKSVC